MSPILRLEALTKDYRSGLLGRGTARRALDGVSLEVEAGEIFGIVGESGCGKSTLARLAAALDAPTAGRVRLGGADLAAMPGRALARARRDVQMVFQDPYGSLNPRHRISRIVAEPLHTLENRPSRVERAERVEAVLRDVGLDAADATRFPHEFSGGQRQRVALARALVTRPRLVIADEPVSALDLSVQAQVLNLVLDLREREGIAFLFISHDLRVVDAVCDRLAVMYLGRIVERGPAEAVFARPLHPYTRLLLQAEAGGGRDGPPPFPDEPQGWHGCAFRARCAFATERCRMETPEERRPGGHEGGRGVACHHAEAVAERPL